MKYSYFLTLMMSFLMLSCGSDSELSAEALILEGLTGEDFTFSDGDNLQSLVNDFVVPTSKSGLSINWHSNSNLLSYDSGNFRVSLSDEAKTVLITATIQDGSKERSRDFELQLEPLTLYFSGRYDNGSERQLGYWTSENSNFISVEETPSYGVLKASYVFNNTLYLAYENGNDLAYWVDGAETSLEVEAFGNEVSNIYVNSSGVFLSGRANESGNPSTSNSSAFWDEDALIHLDDTDSLGNNTGVAIGMVEKNDEILVVGHRLNGGFASPGQWNTDDSSCASGECDDNSWASYPDPASAACPNRYTRGCILEDVAMNQSGEVVALGRCQRSDSASQTCGDATYAYRHVIFRDGVIEDIGDNSFEADKVYFDKSDQYILGKKNQNNGYYKNDGWTTISPENGYTSLSLTDIKVIGGDVFVTGSQVRYDSVTMQPIYLVGYWKNNIWRALTSAEDSYQRVNTIEAIKKR